VHVSLCVKHGFNISVLCGAQGGDYLDHPSLPPPPTSPDRLAVIWGGLGVIWGDSGVIWDGSAVIQGELGDIWGDLGVA
jgi:hypothetical protein